MGKLGYNEFMDQLNQLMKYRLLLFALFTVAIAGAQTPSKEKEFITQIITDPNIIYNNTSNSGYAAAIMRDVLTHNKAKAFYRASNDSVTYVDSAGIHKRMLRREAMPLVLKYRRARMMQIYVDSIKLTDEEYNFILQQLDETAKYRWEKEILTNGRPIETDTLKAVFNDNKHGWDYMHKQGIYAIHSFSMPVFIRNDTYCIFYSDSSCGNLCGGGGLNIYIKENGKWVYWGNIMRWVS